MIRIAALALLLAGCASDAARVADPEPRATLPRIVSINPCVDAVLMHVADPRQIMAISHYSHDPRATSIALDLARRFRATTGTAEDVVALSPDVVIAGAHVAPSTVVAVKRLGVPIVQIGVPASIAESREQIRTIAAAVNRQQRGEALIARIDDTVRAARHANAAPLPALIWQGGGLVPGAQTLASEMLATAGFRNASADYGLKQWDVLPLEPLVARPPRVLLSVGAASHEDRMLSHPVLDHLRGRIAVRPFPERLLHCGGPTIIDALRHLGKVRQSL